MGFYGDSIFNEFSFFNKKKDEKIAKNEFTDEERKSVISLVQKKIKEYIPKAKNDQELIKKMKGEFEKALQNEDLANDEDAAATLGYYKKTKKIPMNLLKLDLNESGIYKDGAMFVIVDAGQYDRVYMCTALNWIVDKIKEDSEFKEMPLVKDRSIVKKFNTGDGDEGCIYINLN